MEKLYSVHFRHIQIEQNPARQFGASTEQGERLKAVSSEVIIRIS
jgi:hypothetical protein